MMNKSGFGACQEDGSCLPVLCQLKFGGGSTMVFQKLGLTPYCRSSEGNPECFSIPREEQHDCTSKAQSKVYKYMDERGSNLSVQHQCVTHKCNSGRMVKKSHKHTKSCGKPSQKSCYTVAANGGPTSY